MPLISLTLLVSVIAVDAEMSLLLFGDIVNLWYWILVWKSSQLLQHRLSWLNWGWQGKFWFSQRINSAESHWIQVYLLLQFSFTNFIWLTEPDWKLNCFESTNLGFCRKQRNAWKKYIKSDKTKARETFDKICHSPICIPQKILFEDGFCIALTLGSFTSYCIYWPWQELFML